MKKTLLLFIIFFAAGLVNLAAEEISGGILDKKVNSDDEDYGAYLIFGKDTDTLFFTSSRPVKNRRPIALAAEIFVSTRPASDRRTKPLNKGWSKAEQIVADASRIAQFTRGSQTVSEDRIIFAAERDLSTETAKGTSYLFDLWQMTKRLDGFSLPEPLTSVNDVDAWDSQPALSQDGKTLFFVTNRGGGKGGLDIWYSVRDAFGNWAAPKPVPGINTEGDEVSPHCGADGKFYFSSNWDFSNGEKGDFGKDIYRSDYQAGGGTLLPVNPVNLDKAIAVDAEEYGLTIPGDLKYNSEDDDEFPFVTPDRRGIFITSNRDADFDKRNIYAFQLPKSRIKVLVNVQERIFDSKGGLIKPPTTKRGLPLELMEKESGMTIEIRSGEEYEVDADKTYKIQFSKFVEEECYQNKIEGPDELEIYTKRPFGLDTLYIRNALITRRKIEIPPIVFHSTDTLPYFITGYWWPNTSKNIDIFRDRESAGFFDETGFVDSTGYEYGSISHKIDSIFENRIYSPLEKLLPLFQDFCQDTLFLKVTIHGYTDPRGLSAGNEHPYRPQSRYKRIYKDETVTVGVDANGNPVTIFSGINMFKKKWKDETEGGSGDRIVLPNDGEEGNVLLSKLRANYTFETFDRDMRERSPIYSQLRDNGRVILDAEGFGIDKEGYKERNLRDDPQSRRIEIYLDVLRPEEINAHKRLPGGEMLAQEKEINIVKPDVPDEGIKKISDQPVTARELPPDAELEVSINEAEEEMEAAPDKVKEEGANELKTRDIGNASLKPDFTRDSRPQASKPLSPPKENPTASQPYESESCYSLQYHTYENREEAMRALEVLKSQGVEDAKVLPYFDAFGNADYRLRSGCYKTTSEAALKIGTLRDAVEALGLRKKPIIVR